jgi:hypothetical protein
VYGTFDVASAVDLADADTVVVLSCKELVDRFGALLLAVCGGAATAVAGGGRPALPTSGAGGRSSLA